MCGLTIMACYITFYYMCYYVVIEYVFISIDHCNKYMCNQDVIEFVL